MKKFLAIFMLSMLYINIAHSTNFYLLHRPPWDGKKWDLPINAIACLDFWTLAQASQIGGIQSGWSVCNSSTSIPDPNVIDLGSDLDAPLSGKNSLAIQTNLSVVSATTLRDALWELATQHSDPYLQTSWGPLHCGKNLQMELKIGGQTIQSKVIDSKSPEWPQFLWAKQEQYRELADGVSKGEYSPGENQKQLTIWKEEYGIADPTIFIPTDLPKVQPIPHQTTYSENWNCANSASLTCNQTWADDVAGYQIVSNRAAEQLTGASYASHITSPLSSNNVQVQAQVITLNTVGGSATSGGVTMRNSGSAITFYFMNLIQDTGGVKDMDCQRVVAGAPTTISRPALAWVLPATIKGTVGEISGSTIRGYYNGNLVVDTTDLTIDGVITGGKLSGIFATLAAGNAAGDVVLDNWVACDLTEECGTEIEGRRRTWIGQ